MRRRQLLESGYLWALSAAAPAFAQSYPDRPIRIYQGFAPGGNADVIARVVSTEMGQSMGQTFLVEGQTGAGGTIAATMVARARPDGYTLLLATGGHSVAGALYNVLPYKTVADFQMISTVTYFPFLIVVNANSKLRSFKDVVATAQAAPESITFGSAGVGSTHHLAGELLAKMAKAPMLHIPYRGDAASLTAVMAGDVSLIIAPPTAVVAGIQAGKLRALATTGPQRWPGLPNVPTLAEEGVTGYDVRSWAGLMAPAGTPPSIVDRLNAEVRKALQNSSVGERLEAMGGEARSSTPDEMKALVASELDRWTRVVAEARIPKQ